MPNYKLVFDLSDGSKLEAGTIEVPHDAIVLGDKVEALEQNFAETAEAVGEAMEDIDQRVTDLENSEALPAVTEEHEGMVLRVVDGEWLPSEGADENTEERLSALEARLEEHINPYVNISVSASGFGTYEKGVTVNQVTVKWNYNRTPQSLTISGPGIDGTKVLAVTDKSYTIPTSLGINCDNTKNFKWTITVTGDKGEVRSATTSPITFQNRVYYGTAADPRESGGSITDSFIKGLQNKPLSAGKVTSINVNAADGQYIWYCLPEWMGECIFMSGANQLIWDKVDFMLNTINDYSELYYVYRSGNEGLGNQKLGVEGVG